MQNTLGRISQRKNELAASTLPEVGKIKVGEKVQKNGKEYPRSLDYFRATGNFAPAFIAAYGERPTKLTVVFITDNLQEVCNERFEAWVKGKRFGWGDGESFTVWDTTEKRYIENVQPRDPRVIRLKWDTMLTLRFILLELKGIMGYWTFTSKGKETTIPSIVKSFDFVRGRAGTIIGFPFNLTVQKHTGYNPEEAKSYPIVSLVPNFSQANIDKVRDYIASGGAVNQLTTQMVINDQKLLTHGES